MLIQPRSKASAEPRMGKAILATQPVIVPFPMTVMRGHASTGSTAGSVLCGPCCWLGVEKEVAEALGLVNALGPADARWACKCPLGRQMPVGPADALGPADARWPANARWAGRCPLAGSCPWASSCPWAGRCPLGGGSAAPGGPGAGHGAERPLRRQARVAPTLRPRSLRLPLRLKGEGRNPAL